MDAYDERTPEEYELLYLHGFHEVKGLPGVWQRGRAGTGVSVDPEGPYTAEEALEKIRKLRETWSED